MLKRYTRGFTLIELLVVIAIIGILASVVLISLQSARKKGNDSRVISDVQQLRTQAESVYNGSNYSAAFTPNNATKTGRSLGAAGQGLTGATAIQLADDAKNNGGDLFVITNTTGPTAYAIYGVLPSVAALNTYFCIASDGSTKQSTTNTYADVAAFNARITAGGALCQ
jgi:prepilin-type N-terminal cleavage/methylation domain-containing protein